MAEVKLRLNLDTEEVELVVDGAVALTSGKEVLHSWVGAINEKHKSVEQPVEDKKVDVESPVESSKEELDKPDETVVD